MSAAGIIFSNLNDNTLSRLTADRTVAAIPFGCRYRLVDFALSNMVNAGISNISLIANYNYRSLNEHIGSGKDWDLARRAGGIRFISPYQTARTPNSVMYLHHLEALKSMQEFVMEISEDTVVLCDTDNICNIDLATIIEEHEARGADITMVTTPCNPDFSSKGALMMVNSDDSDRVTGIVKSTKPVEGYPDRFINLYVVRTAYLTYILNVSFSENLQSLSEDVIMKHIGDRKFYIHRFDGFVPQVSSFTDYYRHSIALTREPLLREQLFGVKDRPIYTKVHNSAPVLYKAGAEVKNSMIADGCVIEGTVENSILFRGVKVGRGAVVRDSILFGGTDIGDGSTIQCVVADKNVSVSAHSTLSGAPTLPFFISKGRRV